MRVPKYFLFVFVVTN